MWDIRWSRMSLAFLLISVFLTGCKLEGCMFWGEPIERTYVEVVVTEDSPPIFRISGDKEFRTSAKIESIQVFFLEDRTTRAKWFWDIKATDQSIPLRKVVYGFAPDGFTELTKALPLEPGARYILRIHRNARDIYFINKPGHYSEPVPVPDFDTL